MIKDEELLKETKVGKESRWVKAPSKGVCTSAGGLGRFSPLAILES